MISTGVVLYAIVPNDTTGMAREPEPQVRLFVSQLGQDPGTNVQTYTPGFGVDLTPQVRATAAEIASYLGVMP